METFNLKVGDWVRKSNYALIMHKPCIQVTKVRILKFKETLYEINGRIVVDPKHIVIISEKEATELNQKYNSIKLSKTEHDKISSCIREDNGEKKIQYNTEKSVLEKLYFLKIKYPERKELQAYKCIHCEKYHIGKAKLEINNTLQLTLEL